MRLCLWMAVATAASFTSASIKESNFNEYVGDRNTLQRVINISGAAASRFPRDAKCLDEIITDEHMEALAYCLRDSDTTKLGVMMKEISPIRFDSLCRKLDEMNFGPNLMEALAKGYGNEESRWVKAFGIAIDSPVDANNAWFHRGASAKLCELMEGREWEILTAIGRSFCYLVGMKRFDLVRKCFRDSTHFCFPPAVFAAFKGHENEFVEWFKRALASNELTSSYTMIIPITIQQSHWDEIAAYLLQNPNLHAPFISVYGEVGEYRPLAKFVDPLMANTFLGYDGERFLGKPVLAKSLNARQRAHHAFLYRSYRGYPLPLEQSLNNAYGHGHFDEVELSLAVLRELDPQADHSITKQFWAWFKGVRSLVGMKSKLENMKRIFQLVKEHLVIIRDDLFNWPHYFLYQDMIASPSDYYPAHLQEEGVRWAQSEMALIPKTESEAVAKMKNYAGSILHLTGNLSFYLDQGWFEAAKMAFERYDCLRLISRHLNHESLSTLLHWLSPSYLKEKFERELVGTLEDSLGWIAMSANYKLLDDYLDLFSPQFILDSCNPPNYKRRVALMLHLSYKTKSYTQNGTPVNKNSIFFRDWVLLYLWSKNDADLKLLDYYWHNRIFGLYEGYDIMAGGRYWGLVGTLQTESTSIEGLSFEAGPERKLK